MMTDKFNAKEEKKNIHLLAKMYKKTLLDGNFQRWGGVDRGSGWSLKDGINYISNFVKGGAFNNIINVDVAAALKHCNDINDHRSIAYFNDVLADNHKYVSIDGNNTASFLTSFVDGNEEIKIEHEKYDTPVSFNQLTEDEQDDMKYTEKINVVILRDITIDEMCDLFRSLNTSTKLNAQEWRQARISPLSQDIRNYGSDYKDFFKKFIFTKSADLDKRSHEEMIATMALKLNRDFAVECTKNNLDIFYQENAQLKETTKKCLDKIFKVCENITDAISDQSLSPRLKKGEVVTLFDVIHIVCNEQCYNIVDYKIFLEWFLRKNSEFKFKSASVLSAEVEEKSYIHWTKFYKAKKNWNNIRDLYFCAFASDVEELKEQGVIKVRRTSRDSFTFKQKLELAQLQEYKTRNGDQIKVLDIYLGKYEADHVVSVSDGGETTIENGELMPIIENRQKGAKSNQPHFGHQK